MSIASALARGRAAAERLMVDTCVIRRLGSGEGSDEYGNVTRPTTDVYTGKCRLQQPGTGSAEEQESGEASLLLLRFELQLPMSVVGVQADDEVELTASRHDPDLPGRRFMVRGLSHKTHAVMRRLQVEERTS